MRLAGYFSRSMIGDPVWDDDPFLMRYLLSRVLRVAEREGVAAVGALTVRYEAVLPELGFDEAYVWELELWPRRPLTMPVA